MFEKIFALADHARGRNIKLQLYVPSVDKPVPLLIFSHGAGGSNTGYSYVGKFFSERGFFCVHPGHPGSDAALLAGKRYSENRTLILSAIADPENYRQPALDIRLLLDELPALENAASLTIDRSRIVMAGHSLGAFTALILAGASI